MTVGSVAKALNMKVLTGNEGLERIVSGAYICDLLSWVISKSNDGDLWITVLTNLNIVAVAVLANVSCIVIPESIEVEEAIIKKAKEEEIPILSSELNSYEISKLLGKII